LEAKRAQESSRSRANKNLNVINLLAAHTSYKEDFIKHASTEQLAQLVHDPASASQMAEHGRIRAVSKASILTTQKPGDIGTEKRRLVQFDKQK